MPRPVKGEKTEGSGRKPGTPNADTKSLEEICLKHGVHVFEGMVIIAAQETEPNARFDKLERLAPYLYAKRKDLTVGIDPEKSKIEIVLKRWGE